MTLKETLARQISTNSRVRNEIKTTFTRNYNINPMIHVCEK